MNNRVQLEPFEYKLLSEILAVSPKTLMDIQFQLEDSDLPFTVDIIDYNHCSKEFQQIIDRDMVIFK